MAQLMVLLQRWVGVCASLGVAWRRRVGLAAFITLGALALALAPAHAAPDYRFAPPRGDATLVLGPSVLTPEERAYLAQLPEVRVGFALPSFRPYQIIGDDGQVSGLHAEMLASLGRALGLRLRPVIFQRWGDVIAAAKRREIDLIPSIGVNSERAQFLEFTLGAAPMVSAMLKRQGFQGQPDRGRFVVDRFNVATGFVRRRYPDATLVAEADTAEDALQMLADGKGDFHVADLLPTLERLERLAIKGIEVHQMVEYGSGYFHIGVRKDWAPLARILNKGLAIQEPEAARRLDAAIKDHGASAPAVRVRDLEPQHLAVLAQRPVWRVGAVKGLTLLNEINDRGEHVGIGAEYLEAVSRRLGVGLEVVPFADVAGMLDALRGGRIDVVPLLSRSDERSREFGYSAGYVEMPYMIVARSDAPLYWDLKSLRGRRLALPAQHVLRPLLAREYPDIRVVTVPGGMAAMDAVAAGEADAAVEVKFFANLRIQADNDGRLRTVAVVDEIPANFHMATSPQARDLVEPINTALAGIPLGERDRMLRRWIAQDVQPPFPWRRHAATLAVGGVAVMAILALTLWWAARLRREVARRRESDALLQDVAGTAPVVVWRYRLDPGWRVQGLYQSPNAPALLGQPLHADRTPLTSLIEHLPAAKREELLAQERQCWHSGERLSVTLSLDGAEGAVRWLHCEALPSTDRRGRTLWTGFIVDVSAEQALQRRLAREADARQLLLAAASHELRAPAHSLALALQRLDRHRVPPDQQPVLDIARSAVQTLAQLLNDVLDAARFDAGRVRLQPTRFALDALVDELAQAWALAAEAKGLQFEHHVAPTLQGAVLHVDRLRLKQVLMNLLSNACKYTARGTVALRVQAGPDELVFEVHDTGAGLDDAARAQLFKPFVTLHSRAETAPGSSGLGLVVSQHIARLLGGRVEVRSSIGRGSVFALHLPRGVVDADVGTASASAPGAIAANPAIDSSGAAAVPAMAASVGTVPPRVVVCDDDPVCRMLLAEMLADHGYAVAEAADAATALALWKAEPTPALVTDWQMAPMTGAELVAQVRQAEAGGSTRTVVIVCSGEAEPAEGPAANYDQHLRKPLRIEPLVQALRDHGLHGVPHAVQATAGES